MKISYSFGIVDLLHYGHIRALDKAKKDCDLHVFGLIKDQAAKDWLGTIVSDYEERKKVLESLKMIDRIEEQCDWNPLENLRLLHEEFPNAKITVFHGDDIKIFPAKDYLDSIGGKIEATGYYDKLSPSNILKKLNIKEQTKTRSILMSTKANTLISLKNLIKQATIEDIYVVNTQQYANEEESIINEVRKRFKNKKIVVRSSSSKEDCYEYSNAGHYDSVLNVDATDSFCIKSAIDQVIASYELSSNLVNEQVLVQTQTIDVLMSGVIFTRDIKKNRPYYLINYDDNGSTDSVTSGSGGKTMWISKNTGANEVAQEWKNLLVAVYELEDIFKGLVLDIEFAITTKGEVVIFQVRPLAANYKFETAGLDELFLKTKNKAHEQYHTYSCEGTKCFSDMAFWNPSEIIGAKPHPLDYSLYEEIITSSAWNEGLLDLGYTKVHGDLMYKIANKPYISLEKSFYSLTPDEMPKELKSKLVKFYINKLKENPSSHDKIEFEIVYNCFTFDLNKQLSQLRGYSFTDNEINTIKESLYIITKRMISGYADILKKDLKMLNCLNTLCLKKKECLENPKSIQEKVALIKELLRAIKTYGTPQFSRQARCAFVAKALMTSLKDIDIITTEELNEFMNNIHTVASEFEEDFDLLTNEMISREEFNQKYGHLRAGTYDIKAICYDSITFTKSKNRNANLNSKNKSTFSSEKIEFILKKWDIGVDADHFIDFVRSALEQREKFKFEFTKSLSLIIETIASIGQALDFDRESMSFIELTDLECIANMDATYKMKSYLEDIISARKNKNYENDLIILPDVIFSDNDIDVILMAESRPNFITEEKITKEICILDDVETDITGKIVVISKADPGYDWIFSKNIAGLITEYGGVASHMAIRCAEFKIPAAIGCGKKIFDYVKTCSHIQLDCKLQKIIEGAEV